MLDKIKRYTKEEEQAIIAKFVNEDNYIHAGSSRAVYDGETDQVIKVALDREGRVQNQNEINFYKQHGETGFFARIYGYGEFIVVMEYVDTDERGLMSDFWEYYECSDDTENLDDDFFENWLGIDMEHENLEYIKKIEAKYAEVHKAFVFMTDELDNWTGDNDQIGLTPDGYKFYDYGYNTEYDRKSQVGSMRDIIDNYTNPSLELQYQLIESNYLWRIIDPIEELEP